jgi:seryl-tRNA synthetase
MTLQEKTNNCNYFGQKSKTGAKMTLQEQLRKLEIKRNELTEERNAVIREIEKLEQKQRENEVIK